MSLPSKVVKMVRKLLGPEQEIPANFEEVYWQVKELSDRFAGRQMLNHQLVAFMLVYTMGMQTAKVDDYDEIPEETSEESSGEESNEDEIACNAIFPPGTKVTVKYDGQEKEGEVLGAPPPGTDKYRIKVYDDERQFRLISKDKVAGKASDQIKEPDDE